jgi:hypothetical protein
MYKGGIGIRALTIVDIDIVRKHGENIENIDPEK